HRLCAGERFGQEGTIEVQPFVAANDLLDSPSNSFRRSQSFFEAVSRFHLRVLPLSVSGTILVSRRVNHRERKRVFLGELNFWRKHTCLGQSTEQTEMNEEQDTPSPGGTELPTSRRSEAPPRVRRRHRRTWLLVFCGVVVLLLGGFFLWR